ncbi:glycosyltransferase family 2 protein [Planctomonas psychrotolerans]|uniref:glycosyltransferase family 2 protein n=1 Tax=Planctomonas psychrotolerans TaxID=2528712 RepID=UPI0012389AB4|nr:glycosyltransferase [Planctomonas psychrotolerans]
MDFTSTKKQVVVAVLTYRRPDDLDEVVPLLLQEIEATGPLAECRLLIVDNDPAGGARDQVRGMPGAEHIGYAHEAAPGIAAARNRALAEAAAADYLVFIDDDERPTRGWLIALLTSATSTGATAVAGPVISTFAAQPDAWVASGSFFDRRRLPTGTAVSLVATNNLILDVHQLTAFGIRFDERFGLSGGSDTMLSLRIAQHGGTMLWNDDAIVHDVVPAKRLTREWVLQRARRMGNSWAVTTLAAAPSRTARTQLRVQHVFRGLVRFSGGGARYVGGLVTGRMSERARGLRTLARGAGLLAGAAGVTYSEYNRK